MDSSTIIQHELRVERVLKASPEQIFDAWTKPEMLKQWWRCGDDSSNAFVEMDLRVGGTYRVGTNKPEFDKPLVSTGKYWEIVRPYRLVFSWSWEKPLMEVMDVGETWVTITIEPQGDQSKLTVIHERFDTVERKEAHFAGWSEGIDRLVRLLEKGHI